MQTYTVTAEKIVFGGDCLTKVNGKNVFVPYAIPGEKLEIEISKSYKDYDTAKIVKILESSPHRVEPFCPLYGKCGGCNMQHIAPDFQQKLRVQMLRDCFEREGIKVPEIQIISGATTGYRSRLQFTDGGLSEKGSNNIVSLTNCPIATAEINQYLSYVPQKDRPQGRVHVFGDKRVLNYKNNNYPGVIIADEIKKATATPQLIQGKPSKNRKIKNKVQHRFAGSTQHTPNVCSVQLKNKKIDFDVQGFFQSNLEVLEKTVDAVCTNMGGSNVLDMYAGCGTFSVFLADIFNKTTLVEHNRDALVFAETNLTGQKHESYGVSGEKFVTQNAKYIIENEGKYDAVVIDPPRSGMEKKVCDWLCECKTGQIRSVSCDPSTHARDASRLLKSGYGLAKLFLLDFYPNTSHIESLAYFEYFD